MKLLAFFSLSLLWLVAAAPVSSAQVDAARLNILSTRMQQQLKTYNRFPASHRQLMDGNSNMAHVAGVLKGMEPALAKSIPRTAFSEPLQARVAPAGSGVSSVSNPSTDLDFSAFEGFTQSETSTAWCGNNVVVGFNDTGSLLQTLLNGTGGGMAFSGVARSSDRGATFKDLGPVPPGANPHNFLGGDPQTGCTSASNFFYAQLFSTSDSSGNPIASIAFSTSSDGGSTWSDPISAVDKDGSAHMVDKEWLGIDPSNSKRMYISYTDFDFTFSNPACPGNIRTAIEIVASKDGGLTWGSPVVIDTVCGGNAVQASHVAVSSNGQVNVAWLHFTNFSVGARELRFTSYAPGKKPHGFTVVDGVVGGGDTFMLQGGFRNFLGMDMIIDRSGGPTDGTIYISWDDGRDKSVPDMGGASGFYAFDDILLRFSADGGATWGFAPIKVNSDAQPRVGYGHDHYQPGIAVDSTGKVGVCWYDRRNDSSNFSIERFCATSTNGITWTNSKVNVASFAPMHGIDSLLLSAYMGDYDGVATDSTKANAGFIGAFQVMGAKANPDVKAFSFQ